MKSRLFILIIVILGLLSATESVYQLKAYDGSFQRTSVQKDRWQNFSKEIVFEWKEPWGDISNYLYYFGKNKNGLPANKVTGNSLKLKITEGEGIYYFNILAVDSKNIKSEVRTFIVKYDPVKPLNSLQLTAYADKSKQNPLASGSKQALTIQPYLFFNTNALQLTGAPLKGINIYWGPEKNGQPDRQIYTNELQITDPIQKDKDYYLNANIEDEAGNISETKTLFVFNYNGALPETQDKPEISILGRDINVDNSPDKEGVIPGSLVKYTIKLKNKGNGKALNVEIKDIIPANTQCIIGGASSDKPAIIEYWDEQINGRNGAWTAIPDSLNSKISQIRWLFTEPFNSQNEATIYYTVRVNQ